VKVRCQTSKSIFDAHLHQLPSSTKWMIGTIFDAQQQSMRVVAAITLLVLLVDEGAAFFVSRPTFGYGETKICMAAGADVERVVKTSTSAVDPL